MVWFGLACLEVLLLCILAQDDGRVCSFLRLTASNQPNAKTTQEINMAIVFFISGLALNTSELKKALARESLPTVIFGFVMISFVTPILGFAMREIPLTPPAFAVGLTIFCLVRVTAPYGGGGCGGGLVVLASRYDGSAAATAAEE